MLGNFARYYPDRKGPTQQKPRQDSRSGRGEFIKGENYML